MNLDSLLLPFVPAPGLTPTQQQQIQGYLDLLLRWNQKTNLTSIREPEEIVTRHLGESFFLAAAVVQKITADQTHNVGIASDDARNAGTCRDFVDIGSGAGFPGIPLKIYAPHLRGTLVESQNKKATFLKEVVRSLKLKDLEVLHGRVEELVRLSAPKFGLVTLRAVERFEQILPIAAELLAPHGRLALLIGTAQTEVAAKLLPSVVWELPRPLPLSQARILLVGDRTEKQG